MNGVTEPTVEDASLDRLKDLGWSATPEAYGLTAPCRRTLPVTAARPRTPSALPRSARSQGKSDLIPSDSFRPLGQLPQNISMVRSKTIGSTAPYSYNDPVPERGRSLQGIQQVEREAG